VPYGGVVDPGIYEAQGRALLSCFFHGRPVAPVRVGTIDREGVDSVVVVDGHRFAVLRRSTPGFEPDLLVVLDPPRLGTNANKELPESATTS
jgi:hypothetical protein